MDATSDLTTDYIERRAKFKKRAETNLNRKVLDGLKQIGRCSNRKIYAYDEQQVEKLFQAVEAALFDARKKFAEETGETRGVWVEL
jgi:ribosome biogenesis protein Nip4